MGGWRLGGTHCMLCMRDKEDCGRRGENVRVGVDFRITCLQEWV